MCGINGIFAYERGTVDVAELERTRDRMAARGPDGAGQWISADHRIGLAHRRLAIIDPAAGAQPMLLEGGRYVITFNGEIYNFAELRTKLVGLGEQFATHSDTEVLLHLYRRHGPAMVDQLRGMFAFGIWDGSKRELFLARDPYGIKPLYYAVKGGVFRFASQVKALLASGAIDAAVDPGGLVGFLTWGSVPEPLTICANVRALPAGSHMTVREGTGPTLPTVYWTLVAAIHRSMASASGVRVGDEVEVLRSALQDSVRAHMVSDVPVGAFLSAGLDSSTIVGLARQISGSALQTITLTSKGMAGSVVDEAPGAIELARHLQVQHSLLEVDTHEFDADLPDFFDAMDQPTVDGLNTWFVSKAAREAGLKVALSGLGGDELLGGYRTFADIPAAVGRHPIVRQIPFAPAAHRWFTEHVGSRYMNRHARESARFEFPDSYAGAYAVERGLLRPWQLPALIDRDLLDAGTRALGAALATQHSDGFDSLPPLGKVMVLEEAHYMRNQLLRDSDWAGMAQSLEIRVPLVDRDLTERVAGLAALGRLGKNKRALGQVLQPSLPEGILNRAKTGFTLPIWKWLRKSDEAQIWKTNPLLQKSHLNDYSRWAFTVLTKAGHCQVRRGLLSVT